MEIKDVIARWDSGEGKPYKGSLIDWSGYEADPENMGCMCAQGQVLSLVGGWSPEKLRDARQDVADMETAKLLNISRAHAILLRHTNDKQDGAPSIVLTDPAKILGDQWSKLLDFWWALHNFEAKQWAAAWDTAWEAARDTAWEAARAAARDAARAAARAAAWDAAWDTAWDAAWDAAREAAREAARAAAGDAAWEIQGSQIIKHTGGHFYFLPMFGFETPDDIPPRPAGYGNGLVSPPNTGAKQ